MRTVIIATAAAVVIALWLFAPKPAADISTALLAPTSISYWDAHMHAHLGGIPVQHFEDLSLVFTESDDKQAPPARLVVDTGQRK